MIWPLPQVSGSRLLQALREVEVGASNIYSHGSDGGSVAESYLKWVSDTVRTLRLLVAPSDLRRLVLTEAYWSVLSIPNPAAAPPLMRAIHDEISARQQDTKAAVEQVETFLHSWQSLPELTVLLVPDTNVLLHHEMELEGIPWHDVIDGAVRALDAVCIVLPLVVIDELDDQKRERARTRARRALNAIYAYFEHGTNGRAIVHPGSTARGAVQLRLLIDSPDRICLPRPDDELVDRAVALQSLLAQPVDFVTFDTGAAIRATVAGLRTHRLVHPDHR